MFINSGFVGKDQGEEEAKETVSSRGGTNTGLESGGNQA